jgi:hypothetical protein
MRGIELQITYNKLFFYNFLYFSKSINKNYFKPCNIRVSAKKRLDKNRMKSLCLTMNIEIALVNIVILLLYQLLRDIQQLYSP